MSIIKETLPTKQNYFSNGFQCLLSRRHCPGNKVISPLGFNVYYQGDTALETKLFLQPVSMSIMKETLPTKQSSFFNRFQCLLSRRRCSGNLVNSPTEFNVYFQGDIALETKLFFQPVSMSFIKETLPWKQSNSPTGFNVCYEGDIALQTKLFHQPVVSISIFMEILLWKQSSFFNRFQCLLSRRRCSGNRVNYPTDFNVFYLGDDA